MTIKSNSLITVRPLVTERKLEISVSNGLEGIAKKTLGTKVLDLKLVSANNLDYAAFHGFKQRIVDKAAIGQFDKSGAKVTPEMKMEAMWGLVDYYNSGAEDWSPSRSERIGSDELMLCRALGELKPQASADEIRGIVAGWTKEQRQAMMLRGEIKAVVERLVGETLKDIDTDGLLEAAGL